MRFGSLFAGIGGFDLGLERAGMAPAWEVEIDPFCRRVLAKHWPDVPRFEDVHHVGKHNLEAVDLICGGFPCQPHSLAGKRRGANDDRDLWPEMRRIIDELRPRWVLAENVVGIRTTILDTVLSDLEGMGYTWGAAVVPAVAVDAPHRRDRIWIVGHTERSGCARRPWQSRQTGRIEPANGSDVDAHADEGDSGWGAEQPQREATGRTPVDGNRQDIADASKPGLSQPERQRQHGRSTAECDWRSTQPGLGGMADGLPRWLDMPDGVPAVARGIPDRVSRLKALGNAVVPQVVEWIGHYIMEVDAA